MNNREFDDIIKKKLESLNTNGSEDAWDLFKEKWDTESSLENDSESLSSQDKDLEDKIKKDMQGLRIPFNSRHWIILKAQLESEALFKKKLFVAKSVELLILAFLVLGILNLWPIQNDIYQIPVYDIPMVASIPVNKATAEKHAAQEEARLAQQNVLNNQIYTSTKEVLQKVIASNESLSFYKNIESEKTDLRKSFEEEKIDEGKSIDLINIKSIEFPFINNTSTDNNVTEYLNSLYTETVPIALLSPNEIDNLKIPIRPVGFPDIVLESISRKKDENTYISFALGPKMNLINSPFDPVYGYDPYNIINTNFNISAKIQKEIGSIEVYAGLGYTNTSYVPRIVKETYEPLESQFNVTSLENIKFKTFNVPIGLKYNFFESNKLQCYTTAGIDVNVIVDSEYIIKDNPQGGFLPPAPASATNSPNSNSNLSQKEFNKGILSGGSLKDNLYASASLSLGLNWNTSTRTGIFIEPRYSHFITSKGIGPNEDRVHSLSIDLGVRYQLN